MSFRKRWAEGWTARIDDLNCNCGLHEPWGHGIGQLLVSLAVQCVKLRFDGLTEPVTVTGEALPDKGSSPEETAKIRAKNYNFWQHAGLMIEDLDAERSSMACSLSEFVPRDKGNVSEARGSGRTYPTALLITRPDPAVPLKQIGSRSS